jgi:ribonuclease HI
LKSHVIENPAANESSDPPTISLFSDGACSGNPGPGGWAYILRDDRTGVEKEHSGAEAATTNNRMELRSCIEGLSALKEQCNVRVYSDSKYLVQGMTEWMPNWRRNQWRRREKNRWKPVKNDDLWKTLAELADRHAVKFEHVAGHSGHPENERCDRMAVAAYQDAFG